MRSVLKFFIKRPLLVNLLNLSVIAFGILSAMQIHKEGYPGVEQALFYITTIYPGASPEEVEVGLTGPLEDSIQTVEGVESYESVSRENFSYLEVYLDESGNVDKIKEELLRAIDNTELPDGVYQNPEIHEWSVALMPVMDIGIYSESGDYEEVRRVALDLSARLKMLSNVSSVGSEGILDREMTAKLNLNALNENYISLQEVILAVMENHYSTTIGSVENGDDVIPFLAERELLTPWRIGDVILRLPFDSENAIRIRDLGTVESGFEEEYYYNRFNGYSGISLEVVKKENADIIQTVDEVYAYLSNYKTTLSNDVEVSALWDLSTTTRTRLKIVTDNALTGFILVLIILFIFMSARNAFWATAGIPFAICFAFIFLFQFGVTINNISLLGMVVVLGMVVDDAIVISENIYRHQLMGKSPEDAALDGTVEVAGAVITSIATTVAVFCAIYLVKGMLGKFAREIPLAVIFVLVGSLIESLLILPAHLAHPMGRRRKTRKERESKFMKNLKRAYMHLLYPILKAKWALLVGFVLLFLASLFVLFSGHVLKFIAFPTNESMALSLNGETVGGQNLDYSLETVELLEEFVAQYSTNIIESYSATVGEIGYPEKFSFEIKFTPPSTREVSGNDIREEMKAFMEVSGLFTNYFFALDTGGPPMGRGIELHVMGNDDEVRTQLVDEITAFLKSTPGTSEVLRSDEENKSEKRITIDYENCAMLNVSPLTLGQTVRAAFYGIEAETFETESDRYTIRVRLSDAYSGSFSTLYRLNILNSFQKLIPIENLISVSDEKVLSKIYHYNGERDTIIEAEVDNENMTASELFSLIESEYENFETEYPGFQLIVGGEAKSSREAIQSMLTAFWSGLTMVIIIIFLQFRKASDTAIVIAAIPSTFIGVAIALWTHGEPLSYLALFGGVGLVGVVVNDSVVMVDYLNSIRKKMTKENAAKYIVRGASTRLRPVLVTTLTTVVGLLPTAYGFSGLDDMIMPCTLVIAWGLVFATLMTLIFIPTLYLIFLDVSFKIKKPKKSRAKALDA